MNIEKAEKLVAKIIHRNEYRAKKKAKNDFEKDFFELMNNWDFVKTMENVKKHRYINLAITEKRINYLVAQPNFHSSKFFTENYSQQKWENLKYLWISQY